MSSTTAQPAIGFIGLGDQRLPMATAIAEASYPLHVWARRPGSLDALGNVAHVRPDDSRDLAASCGIVALCVSTDEDVIQIVTGALLDGLRRGLSWSITAPARPATPSCSPRRAREPAWTSSTPTPAEDGPPPKRGR
jgi:NAD binding domain of 6-phosphogluconate dehydrogenase